MKKTQQKEIENVTNITGVRQIELWRRDDLQHPRLDEVAEEVPVALVYNGISHVVMMASPKDLEYFALGFSLSEGIIESPRDIFGMDVVPSCNGLLLVKQARENRDLAMEQMKARSDMRQRHMDARMKMNMQEMMGEKANRKAVKAVGKIH